MGAKHLELEKNKNRSWKRVKTAKGTREVTCASNPTGHCTKNTPKSDPPLPRSFRLMSWMGMNELTLHHPRMPRTCRECFSLYALSAGESIDDIIPLYMSHVTKKIEMQPNKQSHGQHSTTKTMNLFGPVCANCPVTCCADSVILFFKGFLCCIIPLLGIWYSSHGDAVISPFQQATTPGIQAVTLKTRR